MRVYPFHNDHSDYDFSAIQKVISEYYPAPSDARLTEENVAQFEGFIKIGERVNQEFINQKAYRAKWGKFASALKKKLKKTVWHEPDLSGAGAFKGEIILKETKLEDFAHTKTLKFHISILGPFFTIYGLDTSTVFSKLDHTYGDHTGHFNATNAITTSPLYEYELLFKAVEKEIREFFPGYLFVPYRIGMSTIKNISPEDDSRDPRFMDTVYEGVFGTTAVHDCRARGDERYGYRDWLKNLSNNEIFLHGKLKGHIQNLSPEVTVHKVWKLKESKDLNSFIKTGNLMFTIDLFDVIDLTDPSELILIADNERGTIDKMSYTLQDGIIRYSPELSFRISELTQNTLTLVVNIDFQQGEVSLKGEIREMKFGTMTET